MDKKSHGRRQHVGATLVNVSHMVVGDMTKFRPMVVGDMTKFRHIVVGGMYRARFHRG